MTLKTLSAAKIKISGVLQQSLKDGLFSEWDKLCLRPTSLSVNLSGSKSQTRRKAS